MNPHAEKIRKAIIRDLLDQKPNALTLENAAILGRAIDARLGPLLNMADGLVDAMSYRDDGSMYNAAIADYIDARDAAMKERGA